MKHMMIRYPKVANYGETKMSELMEGNKGIIIRNRRKTEAAVQNAKAVLKIQEEFGSFSEYLWSFSNGKSLILLIIHKKKSRQ